MCHYCNLPCNLANGLEELGVWNCNIAGRKFCGPLFLRYIQPKKRFTNDKRLDMHDTVSRTTYQHPENDISPHNFVQHEWAKMVCQILCPFQPNDTIQNGLNWSFHPNAHSSFNSSQVIKMG